MISTGGLDFKGSLSLLCVLLNGSAETDHTEKGNSVTMKSGENSPWGRSRQQNDPFVDWEGSLGTEG